MKKVSFTNSNNSFAEAINHDVKEYFASTGQSPTGNWKLYLKSATLIPACIIIYLALIFNWLPAAIALLASVVLGFFLACIGFNVMHDACHGSYSTNKNLNYIMGLSMNALGSNAFIWKMKHNIIHHTYTNIDGVDDDIAKSPVLRHCYSQPYKKIHRYQHIYMIPLYAVSSILWALVTDMDKYLKREINGTRMNNFPVQEHIIFWATKVLYIVFYIVIPVYMLGWGPFLAGYFLMNAAMGLTMSFVFQLAHVVENTGFVDATHAGDKLKIEDAWAVHQVKTTSNFATDSKILSWFVGGLNFQIEHHLFPKVSHIHYPAISKIVQKRCQEFGIKYNNIPSFTSAIGSHISTMKKFGESELPLQAA
ncbi:MAG: acyl-CoA desaturase [Bacteroidia bacterium]